MSNMLSRLFVYRERPNTAPLENFLTEAFAICFERLDGYFKCSLLKKLLPISCHAALESTFTNISEVEIITQVTLGASSKGKRPDIAIRLGNRYIAAIEVKIHARFQSHVGPALDGTSVEVVTRGQLETYAGWVRDENASKVDAWPGAMIFLTGGTPAPDDFVEGRPDGVIRSTITWKDIGDWTIANSEHLGKSNLAFDLYLFLKEERLMTQYANSSDLNNARLYASSNYAMRTTFKDIAEAVAKHVPKLSAGRRVHVEFWDEGSTYSGYFYFARSVKRPFV